MLCVGVDASRRIADLWSHTYSTDGVGINIKLLFFKLHSNIMLLVCWQHSHANAVSVTWNVKIIIFKQKYREKFLKSKKRKEN